MRVVITGGAGFFRSRLAAAILARGTLTDAAGEQRTVREVVLVDLGLPRDWSDPRVHTVSGDLTERGMVDHVITHHTDSVFHLAAVVSGQAEADFDIGMRVNL